MERFIILYTDNLADEEGFRPEPEAIGPFNSRDDARKWLKMYFDFHEKDVKMSLEDDWLTLYIPIPDYHPVNQPRKYNMTNFSIILLHSQVLKKTLKKR